MKTTKVVKTHRAVLTAEAELAEARLRRIEAIAEAVRAGATYAAIMAPTGMSKSLVAKLAVEGGISRPSGRPAKKTEKTT